MAEIIKPNFSVIFDESNPRKPLIKITYPPNQYVIDITKSLEKSPSNINHPLIVTAIERWASAIQWRRFPKLADDLLEMLPDAETAKTCLRQISEAIISGAATQRAKSNHIDAVFTWIMEEADESITYYQQVWNVVKQIQRETRNDSIKFKLAKERLQAEIKEDAYVVETAKKGKLRFNKGDIVKTDNTTVLNFLEAVWINKSDSTNVRIPKKGEASAFRTACLAFKYKLAPKSVKEYFSRGNRALIKLRENPPETFPESPHDKPQIFFGEGLDLSENDLTQSSLHWTLKKRSVPQTKQPAKS